MSKKFTGITSAGSAIPVYDKDAHSALEQKLDLTAFSSVSGDFATHTEVESATSGKADTSAIPSLDGYATEQWVGEQGYLTSVPAEYVTSGELDAAISGKADTSAIPSLEGYATEQWVGEQGYLTEVPESAVSGFATHEEVESATSGKMDVSGLASGSKNLPDFPYITNVYSAYNGIPFLAAYTSGDKLDTSAAVAVSPNFTRNNSQNDGYAKFSGWMENVGIDISGAHKNKRIYITDEGITLSGFSSQSDADRNVNGHYLNINPQNYTDKTMFKNIVAGENEIYVPNDVKTVSGNYDTQYYNYSFIGDFSGNANLGREFTVTLPSATTSVTYTAAQQNWDWLYKGTLTSDSPKTEWKITPNKDYTAKQDYSISTGTFYTFQITQSPFPTTGGVVSASMVTWNDDILATRPWVEEQLSANVPQGVMLTSALEYDANDKISGYAGTAFAGGGEVPEGVMSESGLEYNAANEISGYNGSAISQYGAEKQWLTHDDTLVHLSNASQYALGVNVPAVSQQMGVDETEILASTAASAFTLSEPLSAFNGIKVKLRWWDKVPDCYYNVERFSNSKMSLSWTYFDNITDNAPMEFVAASWTSTDGSSYNLEAGYAKVFSVTATAIGNFTHAAYPLSIIGIGRKN